MNLCTIEEAPKDGVVGYRLVRVSGSDKDDVVYAVTAVVLVVRETPLATHRPEKHPSPRSKYRKHGLLFSCLRFSAGA